MKTKGISKEAIEIIKPEWDKMQEFLAEHSCTDSVEKCEECPRYMDDCDGVDEE